ncbi:MAG: cysteine desulfurase family protein, partial [Verrucomicrobiota bacterium]
MSPFLGEVFGNPSALHQAGRKTRNAVDLARQQVAALIQSRETEITFTSGATESITLALRGAMARLGEGTRLITSSVEHSAVTQTCKDLASSFQAEWKQISCDHSGLPDLSELQQLLQEKPNSTLVSWIWANNETGVISPLPEIAELCADTGAILHVDAVQMAGKLPIDVSTIPIHLLSLSGHKFHAPQGIGVLYRRSGVSIEPLLHGGGQEGGLRSGTENVAGIVGLGAAASWAQTQDPEPLARLRNRFEQSVRELHPNTLVHGAEAPRLPNTSNLFLPGIDGEALLLVLDHLGLCASPGSACGSSAKHPSPVLMGMGFSRSHIKSSARYSLSH